MSAPQADVDPDIAELLDKELGRQRDTLEMIASENFAPRAVLQLQGSVLTNKYAEGRDTCTRVRKMCELGLQLLSWHRNLYLTH